MRTQSRDQRLSGMRSRITGVRWMLVIAVLAALIAVWACSGDEDPVVERDTKAPTIVSTTPVDGATGVALDTEVAVTFSEKVDPVTVSDASIHIMNVDGDCVVQDEVATFTPVGNLDPNTVYTFEVTTAVMDNAGNPLEAEYTAVFTTTDLPRADAGDDVLAEFGGTVTLDATGSTAAAGGVLSYAWTQVSGPSVGALSGATPSFTAPDEMTGLAFEVVVTEGGVESESDLVSVLVLESSTNAFFVHPDGKDLDDGSFDSPVAFIQTAIFKARNTGGDVYVATGLYPGSITLESGVDLYGGLWMGDPDETETTIDGEATAIEGVDVDNVVIRGFVIRSENVTTPGVNSIGLHLAGCTNVLVSQNTVRAGNGGPGVSGADGETGGRGFDGSDATGQGGAAAGIGHGYNGGAGGRGGNGCQPCITWCNGKDGADGARGAGLGGLGGDGGNGDTYDGTGGKGGGVGADGTRGPDGSGGTQFGILRDCGFESTFAANGTGGTHGRGGGGGGGGGGECNNDWGGGGGGGGAGGEAGGGGTGGGGGGASIGLLLTCGSEVEVEGTTIVTGDGGQGGRGGEGGFGGDPGAGGKGKDRGSGGNDPPDGGNGADGGRGGDGGHGGGGVGGSVFGIFQVDSPGCTIYPSTEQSITVGDPGPGGSSSGEDGTDGESEEIRIIVTRF